MLLATGTCLFCNVRLTFHQAQSSKFCDNPQCRWNYARIPSRELCTACARPLAPRELAARACDNAECRQHLFEGKRNREHVELALVTEQARQLRDQRAEAAGIQQPDRYALVVIPSFSAPVTSLPERRRRALRNRLTQLISQATIGRGAPSAPLNASVAAPPSPAQAAIGRACAQCQGSCCRSGGDQAYLTVAAIRRFMDAHPNLRPREVLAAYMDRVSNKTYKGSCIYHSTKGCGLSAEMRSDTCSLYFCDGLKEFRRDVDDTKAVKVFFASASEGVIHRAVFVDEGAVVK